MSSYHPYKQGESSTSGNAANHTEEAGGPPLAVSKTHVKASKRIRGEIACAECRRLKIRCDKMVPCSTCIKRGCASLCPNGTVPPGEGSRFVLAATEHLETNLQKLEARMHALEDALSITYAAHSVGTHPLLELPRDDLDDDHPSAAPSSSDANAHPGDSSAPNSSNLSESLGVLHIDEDGSSIFFGASGGAEVLLNRLSPKHCPLPELDTSYLPAEIVMCCQSFPFPPQNLSVHTLQSSIELFLPKLERAYELVDTMLEHLSWMFHIVSRQQMRDVISVIYKHKLAEYGPHDLALMFVVMGVGAMVDLNLPPYNTEGQHYYKLAQAALALQPVLIEESFVSVKVLHLMSVFNGLSGREQNLETSYALLSLASQVALRIGCHVDPTLWGFTGKEAYDRRVYFWNLVSGSLWQSLVTGRPPIIISSFIDCKIPTPEEENAFQQGEVPLGFGIWGFKASDFLLQVVRATLSAKPPSYSTVLALDKKVRDFGMANPTMPDVEDTTAQSMRNFVRSHYKELILLFLHRGFFSQAMTEFPDNPLLSPYAKSVVTAYQCACFVLDDTRIQYLKKPALCVRIWRIWSLAFCAAVVVGTVAIRGAHLNLQPSPLEQFEAACSVFKSAAQTSSRAARALPVLEPMLQKARATMREMRIPSVGAAVDATMPLFSPADIVVPREPSPPPNMHAANINVMPAARASSSSVRAGNGFAPPPIPHPQSSQRFARYASGPAQPPPSHTSIPSQHGGMPSYRNPPEQATTFAGLSNGWDGMFHETTTAMPQFTGSGSGSGSGAMGGQMLDDRWLYFMNNYDILSDPMLSTS